MFTTQQIEEAEKAANAYMLDIIEDKILSIVDRFKQAGFPVPYQQLGDALCLVARDAYGNGYLKGKYPPPMPSLVDALRQLPSDSPLELTDNR